MPTVSEKTVPLVDRLLELIAVLLLGITTIGTAWCGFQAARWNGQSGDLNGVASTQRIEGSRLFGLATQRITYDSMVVAKYAEASQQGNVKLLQFYRRSVVRPDFLPVLDRWEAAVKAGEPNGRSVRGQGLSRRTVRRLRRRRWQRPNRRAGRVRSGRHRGGLRWHDDPARRSPVFRRSHILVPVPLRPNTPADSGSGAVP